VNRELLSVSNIKLAAPLQLTVHHGKASPIVPDFKYFLREPQFHLDIFKYWQLIPCVLKTYCGPVLSRTNKTGFGATVVFFWFDHMIHDV
jgi:hypothetical protein